MELVLSSAERREAIESLSDTQQQLVRSAYIGHLISLLSLRVSEEVGQEKDKEIEQLRYLATHDELTSALNRRGLKERLEAVTEATAVLYIDATNFKAVNDRYGHKRGDAVIQGIYETLKNSTRSYDIIARVGGDEFVVVLMEESEAEIQLELAGLENERRREKPTKEKQVQLAMRRIARETKSKIRENSDLQAAGYDLAVGGIVCPEGTNVMEIYEQAEKKMKLHKNRQHDSKGKHR